MTKADIVAKISEKLGLEKGDVQATVEALMEEVKTLLSKPELKKQEETFLKTQQLKFQHTISLHLNQQKCSLKQ
jgi:hypothetical protein